MWEGKAEAVAWETNKIAFAERRIKRLPGCTSAQEALHARRIERDLRCGPSARLELS